MPARRQCALARGKRDISEVPVHASLRELHASETVGRVGQTSALTEIVHHIHHMVLLVLTSYMCVSAGDLVTNG